MNILSSVFGNAIGKGLDVVDQFVEDKDQAAKLKQELRFRLQDSADSALREKSNIIQAEASGESCLQRNWRPALMLVCVAIVANNYLLSPYLSWMFDAGLTLDMPDRLWDLMTLGVGGYVAGRSGEKMMRTYQNGRVDKERARQGQ